MSAQGIAPAPDKVKAIEDMPPPVDKTGVKAFIGLAGYYRRFVKNFADVVAPLQSLLKSDAPFVWGGGTGRSNAGRKGCVVRTAGAVGTPRL